jgi:crotonobetainyl-CoA:carnitine CoA-transferase CaiB-like acyl-CoA transferase
MGALDGVVVLDLTRLLPGAVATMILRSEGAEVIKVEEPESGDYARSMPPMIGKSGAVFQFTNAGKKSVAINLKSPDGGKVFRRLLSKADILIEGFRPGVMERLGLSWPDLTIEFPRLIYASLTGYPRESGEAAAAGHDLNYMAAAGLLGWPPTVPATQNADICGGSMQVVQAVLLAIIERNRTGRGARIDVSMSRGVWPLAAAPAAFAAASAGNPLSGAFPCYNLYETSDQEWLAVGALEPRFWSEFCEAMGEREWVARQFDPLLKPSLAAAIRSRSCAAWETVFAGRDCCVNRVEHSPRFARPVEPPPELGQDNELLRES